MLLKKKNFILHSFSLCSIDISMEVLKLTYSGCRSTTHFSMLTYPAVFQCWPVPSNFSSQQLLNGFSANEDDVIHWHAIIGWTNQRQWEIILPYEATHGLWKGAHTHTHTKMIYYDLQLIIFRLVYKLILTNSPKVSMIILRYTVLTWEKQRFYHFYQQIIKKNYQIVIKESSMYFWPALATSFFF